MYIFFCFIEIFKNECETHEHLCTDDCKDTTIGYECVCPVNGTMLDTDQHTCIGKQIINLIYFHCVHCTCALVDGLLYKAFFTLSDI